MKENNVKINELALRLKNGDNSAFEELYKLTSPKAYFVALQICGDKHEAEDIVQESYVTVIAKINALEKTEGFMSWFNCIVANKSKDYLRKRRPVFLEEGDEEKLFSSGEESEFQPESNVDREELRDTVMSAIEELSVEKRACVLMKYFDDMSVNDIAKSIEVPVSTVKNRLLAARRELKTRFEKKGITAAYSIAPFGVVGWALNSSFETFVQSFDGSATAAKILSGIAVAGTGAAVAAGSGAAATAGTTAAGTAAKAVAATTFQKIAAGAAIAGVVTGSTIGITSVVRNKKDNIPEEPVTSYSEYADVQSAVIPIIAEENTQVNVIDEANVLNADRPKRYNQSVYLGAMPYGLNGLGELKPGTNTLYFSDDEHNEFYAEFNAPETGYYIFSEQSKVYVTAEDSYVIVAVPKEPQSGDLSGSYHTVNGVNYCVAYLEKGLNYIRIGKGGTVESFDMTIEYAGKEIEDIEFVGGKPEIVIGYNENAHYVTDNSDESFMNEFDIRFTFDSGKSVNLDNAYIMGYVEDGFKDGENDVIFFIDDYEHSEKITAHYPDYYVKDIELTNLDEFCVAKIGSEGFTYLEPENYEVTVTYGDGRKETFDGAKWDKRIKTDNGPELEVKFKTTELRDREALKFSVVIGEHEYLSALCTVTEFDPIGLRLMLTGYEHNRFFGENGYIDDALLFFDKPDDLKGYLYNSIAVPNNLLAGTFKGIKSRLGHELDYVITVYKICTENKFDLI